jgi:hypothetical protein
MSEERPLLERFGLAYFERRASKLPPVVADDEIHVLNPRELRDLRSIHRWTVIRAALIGAASGFIAALAEVLALPLLGDNPQEATFAMQLEFYGWVFGVAGVATIFEIGFLYWDALRSVHDLARAAGLSLFDDDEDERNEVAAALARAALELPNPVTSIFDIDPLKESNKLVLVGVALFYKLKVGVTNFLMKAFIRRAAGRAAVRTALVWVAVPVTALWNAVVAYLVMREARIRAMGPSAARAFAGIVLDGRELSDDGRLAVMRAVGANIVRTQELHPNLITFLQEVQRQVGDPPEAPLDDTREFLAQLRRLPKEEQDVALMILSVGAVLDGKVNRRERKLIRRALAETGRDDSTGPLDDLRVMFARGHEIDPTVVEACAPTPQAIP